MDLHDGFSSFPAGSREDFRRRIRICGQICRILASRGQNLGKSTRFLFCSFYFYSLFYVSMAEITVTPCMRCTQMNRISAAKRRGDKERKTERQRDRERQSRRLRLRHFTVWPADGLGHLIYFLLVSLGAAAHGASRTCLFAPGRTRNRGFL